MVVVHVIGVCGVSTCDSVWCVVEVETNILAVQLTYFFMSHALCSILYIFCSTNK